MESIIKYFQILKQKPISYWISLLRHRLFFKLPNLQVDKRIFLFSVPTYGNLGDQAIAEAEKRYLMKEFSEYQVISIYDYSTRPAIKKVYKIITDDDIVMINGGGNFGNLYPKAERDRNKILKKFKDKSIIIFPVSVYYTNNKDGEKALNQAKAVFSENDRTIITAREELSFNKLKEMFPHIRTLLTPDIVLSLEENLIQNYKVNRKGALFVLRNDTEKYISNTVIEKLRNEVKKYNFEIKQTDTVINKDNIIDEERLELLTEKWQEFYDSKIVITDRLHGMIFAYLTRTPCLVLNNNNGKVEFTYNNWLSKVNFIKLLKTNNSDEIYQALIKLIKVSPSPVDFSNSFADLTSTIKELM